MSHSVLRKQHITNPTVLGKKTKEKRIYSGPLKLIHERNFN